MAILQGLSNYLLYPQYQHLHQYVGAFSEIVNMIQNSRGLNFVVCKVRAHRGLKINDFADTAAKTGWLAAADNQQAVLEAMSASAAKNLRADLHKLQSHAFTDHLETENVDQPPGGVTLRIPAWF